MFEKEKNVPQINDFMLKKKWNWKSSSGIWLRQKEKAKNVYTWNLMDVIYAFPSLEKSTAGRCCVGKRVSLEAGSSACASWAAGLCRMRGRRCAFCPTLSNNIWFHSCCRSCSCLPNVSGLNRGWAGLDSLAAYSLVSKYNSILRSSAKQPPPHELDYTKDSWHIQRTYSESVRMYRKAY